MFPCPNCKKPIVNEEDVRWFGREDGGQAAVYCCPTCYEIASRFYMRAATELKSLIDMLKESTRIALATGRMNFPEQDLSKKELLEAVLQLKDVNDAHRSRPGRGDSKNQPSPQRGGPPPVRPLGGRGGNGSRP